MKSCLALIGRDVSVRCAVQSISNGKKIVNEFCRRNDLCAHISRTPATLRFNSDWLFFMLLSIFAFAWFESCTKGLDVFMTALWIGAALIEHSLSVEYAFVSRTNFVEATSLHSTVERDRIHCANSPSACDGGRSCTARRHLPNNKPSRCRCIAADKMGNAGTNAGIATADPLRSLNMYAVASVIVSVSSVCMLHSTKSTYICVSACVCAYGDMTHLLSSN